VLPEVTQPLPLPPPGIELLDHEATDRDEDAVDLPQGAVWIGEVVEGDEGHNDLEGRVGERQVLSLTRVELEGGTTPLAVRHTLRVGLKDHDLPASRREQLRDRAGPSADIEEPDRRAGLGGLTEEREDWTAASRADDVLEPKEDGHRHVPSGRVAASRMPRSASCAQGLSGHDPPTKQAYFALWGASGLFDPGTAARRNAFRSRFT